MVAYMRDSEIINMWRLDIAQFVSDNFGVMPDNWQRKALEAFADKREKIFRLSLQACAG